MRQLAAEIGVQAAALYRYFPTKQDLLFTLMREHMEGLVEAWDKARPETTSALPRVLPPSSATTSASMSSAATRPMSRTWNCAACRARS